MAGVSNAAGSQGQAQGFAAPGTTVTASAGTVSASVFLSIVAPLPAPPTVSGIAPTQGPPTGGTNVTITGTNFNNGVTGVKFGSVASTSFAVVSPTVVQALAPAQSPALVDVVVTGPGGSSATSAADQFWAISMPTRYLPFPWAPGRLPSLSRWASPRAWPSMPPTISTPPTTAPMR